MPVSLCQGDWELTLRPDLGGAIGRLRHRDRDLLRPTPDDADDALGTACFPLVPYANRIGHGRFVFDGEPVRLRPNFGDHPHSLHGVGWRSAWTIEDVGSDYAKLSHAHAGDTDWPWDYRACQTVRIEPDCLQFTLEMTNESGRPMPGGLGFHPYFVTARGSRLRFSSRRLWQTDEDQLPTRADPPDCLADWENGADCHPQGLIDHCYSGWQGDAVLQTPAGEIVMSAIGAHALHVHIPPGKNIVGLEPVTHMPDAVNRHESAADTGLRILAPGGTLHLSMRIAMRPAPYRL